MAEQSSSSSSKKYFTSLKISISEFDFLEITKFELTKGINRHSELMIEGALALSKSEVEQYESKKALLLSSLALPGISN